MKRARLIPVAPVARLMSRAGAERVSKAAAKTLTEVLEDIALDIGAHAVRISRHAGRKTVNKADIELAGTMRR